jgi:hypothetical protein
MDISAGMVNCTVPSWFASISERTLSAGVHMCFFVKISTKAKNSRSLSKGGAMSSREPKSVLKSQVGPTKAQEEYRRLLKARRMATRSRTEAACRPCKARKIKCSDFRPCARCRTGRPEACIDDSVPDTAEDESPSGQSSPTDAARQRTQQIVSIAGSPKPCVDLFGAGAQPIPFVPHHQGLNDPAAEVCNAIQYDVQSAYIDPRSSSGAWSIPNQGTAQQRSVPTPYWTTTESSKPMIQVVLSELSLFLSSDRSQIRGTRFPMGLLQQVKEIEASRRAPQKRVRTRLERG